MKVYNNEIIVFLISLISVCGSLEITRNADGDTSPGLTSCKTTLVVRNDSTNSIFCATDMTDEEADCNLLIDGSKQFGFIQLSDVNTTTMKVELQPKFPLCQTGYSPIVGDIEVQDYPNNYAELIWNTKLGQYINKTLESNFNDGGLILRIKFWDFFPGLLVRLYIDCYGKNGIKLESTKQCVIYKYEGKAIYPITPESLKNKVTAPTESTITTTPIATTKAMTTKQKESTPTIIATTTTTIATTTTTTTNGTIVVVPTAASAALTSEDEIPWLIIGICIGIFLLIIIVILVICLICKRRKRKQEKEKGLNTQNFALGQNVSFRDNPTYLVTDVTDGKIAPEYSTVDKSQKKTPMKGTGTVDSPDKSKVTSSAYMYLGKDKQQPAINNKTPENNHFEPVSVKIPLDTDDELTEPGYSTIGNNNNSFNII